MNQWINHEKEVLAEIVKQHGIEWEQKGTHEEHLDVYNFKKKERKKEVQALEQEKEYLTAENEGLALQIVESREDVQFLKESKEQALRDKKAAEKRAEIAEKQLKGFAEGTYEALKVKNFIFDIPDYWEEEGSKNEYLQYYAEKGEKLVMLSIAYPVETDDDYDVSFDGLYQDIPLVRIEAKTSEINDAIEYDIGKRLKEDFGVDVSGIDIGTIEIDKSSEGYRQLMSITKDVTTVTIKAETAAKVKDIADRQRIDVEHYGESLRIQREESQYAQHKQTQTNNLGAFQVEKQAEVGVAGAEALGKMGANGAGNVNLSGGGDGFNMATMMASMVVGGAVGQNIAGSMNNIMAGMNQPVQNGITPLPVPGVSYYVAMNGQATGPYDLNTLRQMMTAGQFTSDSLVWKTGMPEWAKASSVDEMKQLFPDIPPIPKEN